jgi:predicted Holliday junction resolvase-like endonuclease
MELLNSFLILIAILFLLYLGYKIGTLAKEHEWKEKVPGIRDDAVKKSRAVLTGNFSEQLAPYMPNFPFAPNECKFIGKPVDIIVFKGLDSKEPSEVVFVEVKSGNSQLSPTEKKLKDTIENKRVSWYEYRINSDLKDKEKNKEKS